MCVCINACIFVYVCLPLMKWYVPILVAAHGSSVESYFLCVLENKMAKIRLFHGFNYLEINLKWKHSSSLVHLKYFRWIESQFPKRNSYYTCSLKTFRKSLQQYLSIFQLDERNKLWNADRVYTHPSIYERNSFYGNGL
jgi:hypothetical protein